MELLQLIKVCVEEASRPLYEEVAALKLLLERVGDSLESSEGFTHGGLGPVSAQASIPHDFTEQKSYVVEEAHIYGCFSLCGSHCPSLRPTVSVSSECEGMDGILASVLQIAPESHELCGESFVVLPLEPGSLFEASGVATAPSPSQSPAYMESGGVLEHSHEDLFGKELCGLIASLEMASPGYDKDIACVLAGKASGDTIRKVEKSLRKVIIIGKRR
jgi:hypothetical protein